MTPLLAQRAPLDRAFERLYQRHVGDVYRYALVVLRNPSDAEDVTQTTFMNAYRAFQRGQRPRTPQNWLISIAHNVCRQRFRQSARRPEEVAFDEEIGDGNLEEEQGPSAEDIQRALGHLAFNQRAALVMRELEGRTYGEIADILGVSVSAVETLLFRARRALREQLEGSLTCGEAELAISRQMDGRLPRAERGALRAHLRECPECARFARSQRAHRAAFKTLAALPLPGSLGSFFGGGGAAVGTGIAVKAAAFLAAGAVVAGGSYQVARHAPLNQARADTPQAGQQAAARPTAVAAPRPVDGGATSAARGRERADAARAGEPSSARDPRGVGPRARATGDDTAKQQGGSKASGSSNGRGARAGPKPKHAKTRHTVHRKSSRGKARRHQPSETGEEAPPANTAKNPRTKQAVTVSVPTLPTVTTPSLPPVKIK